MKISNQNHVFGFIESLIPRVDYCDIRSVVHCTKSTSRKPWPIQQRNLGGIITIRDSIIIRVNWRSLSNLQCFRSLALNNQQETSEVKPVFSLNLRFKTSKIAKDTTISLYDSRKSVNWDARTSENFWIILKAQYLIIPDWWLPKMKFSFQWTARFK